MTQQNFSSTNVSGSPGVEVEVGGMEVDSNEWEGCFNTSQFPVPMGGGRV